MDSLKILNFNTEKWDLNEGGFYSGFVRRPLAEIQKMEWEGKRFGLWLTRGRSVVIVPVLAEKGGRLVQLRFWTNPSFKNKLKGNFMELLRESTPLARYKN